MGKEKAFYVKHHSTLGNLCAQTSAEFETDIRKRGHRYFCVHDRLQEAGKLRALELGFGHLDHCLYFSSFFSDFTAVDIAAAEILRHSAQDTSVPGMHLVEHDLNEDLPFPDGHFDVVIAMMVIEHLFDPFHSFREVSRVLAKRGHAFVNLPLVSSLGNRVRLLLGKLPLTSTRNWWELEEWDGGHLHYFTIDSMRGLAQKNGLDLEAIYPVGRAYVVKSLWPSLLCSEASFVLRKANRKSR